MVSTPSLPLTSKVTARPLTSATRTEIVAVMPSRVAARWSISTRVPTESSPGSRCSSSSSRQVTSTSRTSIGVAYTRAFSPMNPMVRSRSTG